MRKNLLVLCSVAALTLNFCGATVFAEVKKVKKEHKETKEQKPEEVKLEGTVEKKGTDFYLKTTDEDLKLPVSKEKDSKIKLDDFVGKKVKMKTESIVHKNKTGDKHVVEKIDEVKLSEESKKEEPKKDDAK
jgi:hypothetical protein